MQPKKKKTKKKEEEKHDQKKDRQHVLHEGRISIAKARGCRWNQ
jgi:hypothetical protein